MDLSIRTIQDASNNDWDYFWRNCSYSTYFHSREWAQIWNQYTANSLILEPKLVEFTDSRKVLLPLSMWKRNKGLARCYHSSPAGTYGGWLSTEELTADHVRLLVYLLTQRMGDIIWRLNPFDEITTRTCVGIGQLDETLVLNLNEEFEPIFRRWTKGHRSAVHKAMKTGVEIRLAKSHADWEEYFRVYQDSLSRWGEQATSKYEWKLFQLLRALNSSHVRLWLATYKEKVVGGALCFYCNRHAVYWHGAALKEFFHLRATNLLIHESIRRALDEGYSWFDFNPSGGHQGVRAFKASFGCQSLECPVITIETRKSRLLARLVAFLKD